MPLGGRGYVESRSRPAGCQTLRLSRPARRNRKTCAAAGSVADDLHPSDSPGRLSHHSYGQSRAIVNSCPASECADMYSHCPGSRDCVAIGRLSPSAPSPLPVPSLCYLPLRYTGHTLARSPSPVQSLSSPTPACVYCLCVCVCARGCVLCVCPRFPQFALFSVSCRCV